jgi:hypothetical protein
MDIGVKSFEGIRGRLSGGTRAEYRRYEDTENQTAETDSTTIESTEAERLVAADNSAITPTAAQGHPAVEIAKPFILADDDQAIVIGGEVVEPDDGQATWLCRKSCRRPRPGDSGVDKDPGSAGGPNARRLAWRRR